MSSILLTPPVVEPLSLADAKAFLRIEHADDDAVIAALIAGARSHVEAGTRRALIAQTWRLVRDRWPANGRIAVLPAPFIEVLVARVIDEDGTAQAIDVEAFAVDAAAAPAVLAFVPWSMPPPGKRVGGIEIDVSVGYGAAAADVPAPLVQAIRLLVAHWYENRGLIAVGQVVAVVPSAIAALIAPYRVLSL
ncbi:MAG: head-tail connector protein [Xanthobacteraceae bacterium]